MNRITATWRSGCFEKMADYHTKPPSWHPPKMDVLQKTFLQIILAAKWLAQHSIPFPNQKRRSLPSLLYLSFYALYCRMIGRILNALSRNYRNHLGRGESCRGAILWIFSRETIPTYWPHLPPCKSCSTVFDCLLKGTVLRDFLHLISSKTISLKSSIKRTPCWSRTRSIHCYKENEA